MNAELRVLKAREWKDKHEHEDHVTMRGGTLGGETRCDVCQTLIYTGDRALMALEGVASVYLCNTCDQVEADDAARLASSRAAQ